MDFERRESGFGLGWQIAFGVCVGTLAASVIQWAAIEARVRWELHEFGVAQHEQAVRASALQAEQERAAVAAERDRALSVAASQRAAEAGRAAAAAEVNRREEAWRKFYRPSPGCVSSSASVECANEHIRFKREFEERYAAGRL